MKYASFILVLIFVGAIILLNQHDHTVKEPITTAESISSEENVEESSSKNEIVNENYESVEKELSKVDEKPVVIKDKVMPVSKVSEPVSEEETNLGPGDVEQVTQEGEPKPVVEVSETARVDGLWKTPEGKNPTYRQRIEVLEKMGKNLNLVERNELYNFLRNGPSDRDTMHVKDEIMIKIEQQGAPAPEYVNELRSIVADANVDGDVRGYAAQHLRSAYIHADDKEREDIRETFYEGLKDNESDVSGTSLLSVINLHERFGGFDEEKIDEAALNLSVSDNVHLPSRITAMTLVGERRLEKVLPVARDQAVNGADTVMQVASIAALGEVGTEDDLKFLDEVLEDRKKRFYHEAAKLSKSKIKMRLNL